MEEEVVILSSGTPGKLILRGFSKPNAASEGWYSFVAKFEADGIAASATVHDFDPERLVTLFEEMANEW